MIDAKTLYRDAILAHAKSSVNEGTLADATHEATVKNSLCGDRITLRLRVTNGVVRSAKFEARGCAIARASASLLAETVTDLPVDEALALRAVVDALVTPNSGDPTNAGVLEALRGAREFPARRACVTLPWQALQQALSVSKQ